MVFNFPNLLTLSRVCIIPLYALAATWPKHWLAWVALGFFLLASVTDFLDGYLARTTNQETAFGRFLDPLADKLLIVVALVVLVWTDAIASWSIIAALIIIGREIVVSGLREFMAGVDIKVPVSHLAKWKTAAQMISISLLTITFVSPLWMQASLIGTVALWISAFLTSITGFDYLKRSLHTISTIK